MQSKMPSFEWSQDGAEKLEVRMALSGFGGSINPKALAVEVKEQDIVVVKHDDTVILQQRLHDNVAVDEWAVENGTTLVIDFKKSDADSWPCLLRQPMRPDDHRFVRGDALDALLRVEMCKLPRDAEVEAKLAAADAAEAGSDAPVAAANSDDDFDDLLDEALEEVDGAAASGEGQQDEAAAKKAARAKAAVESEIKMTAEEFAELDKIRAATVDQIAESQANAEATEADREKLQQRLKIIDKMIYLSMKVRQVRTKTPTIPVLLEVLKLEIWKGRLNHGGAEESETEAFRDDEEREMAPDALLKKGVASLESSVEDALHYLRLAAIHHNHPVSTCLLQRLYTQMKVLPKAAYFVFRRALMDDCEPSTNLIVGEFADKGMPLFPPYMALVVNFYQRSAAVGSTHAMLTLANTYKQGAVNASPADESSRKANQDEDKFLDWLQAAEDRGSPRAYFIRASLHTTGECGQTKSAKLAKQYIDRVKRTEPSILAKAPALEARINHMLAEEGGSSMPTLERPATATASNTAAAPARTTTVAQRPAASAGNAGSVVDRLRNLEGGAGGAGGRSAGGGFDARPAQRGGMLSAARNNAAANRMKGMLERAVKIGVGCYMVYALAFPVRIIIASQAFEIMAYAMEIFGLGTFIAGRAAGSQGMTF